MNTRERTPKTYPFWKKTALFLLTLLFGVIVILSAGVAILCADNHIYTTPVESLLSETYYDVSIRTAMELETYLAGDDTRFAEYYCANRNIAKVVVSDAKTNRQIWTWFGDSVAGRQDIVYLAIDKYGESWHILEQDIENNQAPILYKFRIDLADSFTKRDAYAFAQTWIQIAYHLRYAVFGIGAAALVLMLLCIIRLLKIAGHNVENDEPHPIWDTRIPFDLQTVVLAIAASFCGAFVSDAGESRQVIGIAAVVFGALLIGAIGLFWCVSLSVRIKTGRLWKELLLYRWGKVFLQVLKRILRWIRNALSQFGRNCKILFSNISLLKKTILFLGVLTLVECFFLIVCFGSGEEDMLLIPWLLEKLLLYPCILWVVLHFRRLQTAGRALAAGDLSYQVDTSGMRWDVKEHGENLNSIATGMNAAVEQRLKSERFQTELITNVSHDIKTPLTSVINYADLIGREECENPRITEYAQVLHRQSERLKRLIEDLVEASKASTGNLEVLLAPCVANLFITQAEGEFEEKLKNAGVTLITRQPEETVQIMADGRRMWRIFDNLLNNICKYALPGSRAYLTLEQKGNEAVIAFKNTSREPLDRMNMEELLERFVRGDESRSTEGNGLGLAIAKSLTELQGGKLELAADGDLFKVVLRFPVCR